MNGLELYRIACLLCAVVLLSLPSFAQPDRVDPESPFAVELQDNGSMVGTISRSVKVGWGEDFGRRIIPLGSIDGDRYADWAVELLRCDTAIGGATPEEVVVYHGVRDGLPPVSSGQRIGPTELGAMTSLLCAGDWDHDGNRDVAVRIQLFNDTSSGNRDFETSRLVIFWGTSTGQFTVGGTTRLECNADMWLGINFAAGNDQTGDGIDDLLVWSTSGLTNNTIVKQPRLWIFAGRPGQRLKDMFGNGNDGPTAGKGWWRRPWAEIWLPYRLHDGWTGAPEVLYDMGDISGDGISEIWAFSVQ